MSVALGGEMVVAWWDVIGYHTTYPYHFLSWDIICNLFSAYPVLNAPELVNQDVLKALMKVNA